MIAHYREDPLNDQGWTINTRVATLASENYLEQFWLFVFPAHLNILFALRSFVASTYK
jgi:hypothetical protein